MEKFVIHTLQSLVARRNKEDRPFPFSISCPNGTGTTKASYGHNCIIRARANRVFVGQTPISFEFKRGLEIFQSGF